MNRVRRWLDVLVSSTVVGVLFAAGTGCPPAATDPSVDAECAELDSDGDGFARPGPAFICCDPDFVCASDCNDEDPTIHPTSESTPVDDAPEDGIDRDCDGVDGRLGVDG